jgi:beta-glucosidase-like glycosyl hydrolase
VSANKLKVNNKFMSDSHTLNPNKLSLRKQVAQRMICGYQGLDWQSGENNRFQEFLKEGLGGTILFRENLQGINQTSPGPFESGEPTSHCLTPLEIAESNWLLQQHRPLECPPLFISIDQEGGQVERFPWTSFLSGLSPRGLAQTESLAFSNHQTALIREHLYQYGFNLNYFPTLDVNLNPHNPIIGVRAFGDDPTTVWHWGEGALQQYPPHLGVLPCIKHFPGHGHGQVDSHLTLPTLELTDAELYPFQMAIQQNIPMLMVNHGYYPALQGKAGEGRIPASASKTVIQTLLRKRLNYEGVIITDDMAMGAILERWSPVEAALNCLQAGVDILLYRECRFQEWDVFEAVVNALESGVLSMAAHLESVERILTSKQTYLQPPQSPNASWFTQEASDIKLTTNATTQCLTALNWVKQNLNRKIIPTPQTILLISPSRNSIRNYSYDTPLSEDLQACFQEQFPSQKVISIEYNLDADALNAAETDLYKQLETLAFHPDWVLFVTFNAQRFAFQKELWKKLQTQLSSPSNKMPYQVLVSSGMPDDPSVFVGVDLSLPICTYRPQVLKALPVFLNNLILKESTST